MKFHKLALVVWVWTWTWCLFLLQFSAMFNGSEAPPPLDCDEVVEAQRQYSQTLEAMSTSMPRTVSEMVTCLEQATQQPIPALSQLNQ